MVQVLDDIAEALSGLFVKIGDRDSCGEHSVVRVLGCHACRGLCGQVVQLDCGHPRVQTIDHFFGYGRRIYVVHVQAVAYV
ncbi:hypothetical protein BpHYR1_043489 [Brachionus plicatilis]|uniref:Uncharacterized protein n=1 Tax=Brachionus plicatilis TaxID=10195 RepID=A0A3M7P5W4_BRAPC|nr:hypothetical protein BpHYR1_043489 [Brachionus plicatilis]